MSTHHSSQYPALQSHSVGDIYPYSVKHVGDKYCQAFHCLTGEHGPKFYILAGHTTRKQADKLADNWARGRLRGETGNTDRLETLQQLGDLAR